MQGFAIVGLVILYFDLVSLLVGHGVLRTLKIELLQRLAIRI